LGYWHVGREIGTLAWKKTYGTSTKLLCTVQYSYIEILAGWEEDGHGGLEEDLLEPVFCYRTMYNIVTLGYSKLGRKMGMVA